MFMDCMHLELVFVDWIDGCIFVVDSHCVRLIFTDWHDTLRFLAREMDNYIWWMDDAYFSFPFAAFVEIPLLFFFFLLASPATLS